MNLFDRALTKLEEDGVPELRVVAAPNGVGKKAGLPAPLRLLLHVKERKTRPELAVLGWERREQRLTGGK